MSSINKGNMESGFPSFDIDDQLDLLLEYLDKNERMVDTEYEERSADYVAVSGDKPIRPLDLSVKNKSPGDELQRPLSTSLATIPHYSEDTSMSPPPFHAFSFPSFPYQTSFLGTPILSSPGSSTSSCLSGMIERCPSTQTINFSIRPLTRCSNCSTTTTSTWRKDSQGLPLCNACGVYYRVHQRKRPAEWATEGIARRTRKKKTSKQKTVVSSSSLARS